MEIQTDSKYPDDKILRLFPIPLYTGTHIYFEEDLVEMGLADTLKDFNSDDEAVVLQQAETLARIKPELAFHFLLNTRRLLQQVPMGDLGQWTQLVLDIYDSQGLNPAREFILGLERHPAFRRVWGKGLSFRDTEAILMSYLHALGLENVHISAGEQHYTDVQTIYLPERVDAFPEKDLNFLLYKVMVTHKFAQLELGTYRLRLDNMRSLIYSLEQRYGSRVDPEPASDLDRFFGMFPQPILAKDLFNFTETLRIESWIATALPGLYRDLKKLKRHLGLKRILHQEASPKTRLAEAVIYRELTGKGFALRDPHMVGLLESAQVLLEQAGQPAGTPEDIAGITAELYALVDQAPGSYDPPEPIPYMGELKPEEAERGRRRRRESTRDQFRRELAKMIGDLPDCEEIQIEVPEGNVTHANRNNAPKQEIPDHLQINGNPVPAPEAMRKIIREIYEDLGAIPAAYLAISSEMSGHQFRSLCQMPEGTGYVLSEHGEGIHVIDEWDYRRQGYRKRWVLLRETDAPGSDTTFAEETLARYKGMVRQIKRHFQRIQMERTLLRRQKDGDSVDLDAAVEAFTDRRAGLYPSDRLFMRLRRDKRDIATIFLIDLSGSTKGWINEMERAALLILSEAMQVLKDRFAIYGFSGRTRRRCELYRIKGWDEPYNNLIKGRISNLKALEYTRLGPPIRHLTGLLSAMEARTRLLITLSDGKPDDYDGYKGDYGIEDTRQALLEAKTQGIHPFCITIDQAEHSYLTHMYGAVNYAFIDNLSKLPFKIPEIYRKLTT